MLKLSDLIRLSNVELGHFKIHCATGYPNPPLQAFLEGKFKEWQEYQTKRNFQCERILSLIQITTGRWLFAGVWNVHGTPLKKSESKKTWFAYSTSEVPGLEHLTGRAIISFKRTFRASYLVGTRYADLLIVSEILSERITLRDFPGFSSVLLSYAELSHVITRSLPSWRAALSSVAGVYLITDTSCGRHYVGSAYGTQGFWGRWSLYVETPHGFNKKLQQLLSEQGLAHATHFRYSILEICDVLATQDEVLSRESHWKEALGSRDFGYNSN
ncbi:MAG TPA: GIY-YIG nuclease family protein [Lacunisphaera sp.]|jgi:hypothetical protein|nr:GIY-YIG nuclease family protein [Lacunisphaera sp.]HQY05958.1 GIY-YIG nuclease family protein [Lacunisphaera sp.]